MSPKTDNKRKGANGSQGGGVAKKSRTPRTPRQRKDKSSGGSEKRKYQVTIGDFDGVVKAAQPQLDAGLPRSNMLWKLVVPRYQLSFAVCDDCVSYHNGRENPLEEGDVLEVALCDDCAVNNVSGGGSRYLVRDNTVSSGDVLKTHEVAKICEAICRITVSICKECSGALYAAKADSFEVDEQEGSVIVKIPLCESCKLVNALEANFDPEQDDGAKADDGKSEE